MKTHTLLLIAYVLTSTLSADTIELQSGVKYQGKILSEDEKTYLFEIHHSDSIKDERRIPKKEVKNIAVDSADTKDYTTIKAFVPTPDMLSKKSYLKRIELASSFLKKYPGSTRGRINEVNTILKTLKNENEVISNGGFKLKGVLISATQVQKNAYDIDAIILLLKIKKIARSGNYQLSLRSWENLQSNFPYSSAYQESLPIVSRILKAHKAELDKNLNSLERRMNKREAAIKSLDKHDQSRANQVIAEKNKIYEARIDKQKKELKTKWLTIDPFNRQALDYNLRNTKAAINNISRMDTSKLELAAPHISSTLSALNKGNIPDAAAGIKKLTSMKLPPKYIEPLTQQLEEKKLAIAQEKEAEKKRALEAVLKAEAEKKAAEEAEKEAKEARRKARLAS
jgi:hypothetical protein